MAQLSIEVDKLMMAGNDVAVSDESIQEQINVEPVESVSTEEDVDVEIEELAEVPPVNPSNEDVDRQTDELADEENPTQQGPNPCCLWHCHRQHGYIVWQRCENCEIMKTLNKEYEDKAKASENELRTALEEIANFNDKIKWMKNTKVSLH